VFRATFLGNHGWLVTSERSGLLVDPLFFERYGWTESVGLRVWPPRTFQFDRFPAVDAVLLTHEHEGHFDIASLHLIERKVPVYVSSLSSLAMREALREMGFSVRPIAPGTAFEAGDLEVHTMPADQESAWGEEWDNLAFLVRDRGGEGSLFTPVDVAPTRDMRLAVAKVLKRPGLWAHTNNYSSWEFMRSRRAPDQHPLQKLVGNVFNYHRMLSDVWEAPEALLLYGGGFCFGDDRAWINREIFPCDTHAAARALSLMLPGERVIAPSPGETLAMKGGKLVQVAPNAPFVSAPPPEDWPSRGSVGNVKWLDDFGPACGRTEFPASDLPALEEELAGFAGFLYANLPFRRLYSLRAAEVVGRKPTFALLLRAGSSGAHHVLEYQPQACRFAPVASADPIAEYLTVYECWATDLLALFRAEIASPSLALARSRHFNTEVQLFDLDLFLMEYAHPLRHPERFLGLYRKVLAAQKATEPRVRGAKN
jgi:hypothetical protein